jgi:hypothetical protein
LLQQQLVFEAFNGKRKKPHPSKMLSTFNASALPSTNTITAFHYQDAFMLIKPCMMIPGCIIQ